MKGVGAAVGQRGHQLFELAALALPADPALLGLAEVTAAVQQQEAWRAAGRRSRRAIGRAINRAINRAPGRAPSRRPNRRVAGVGSEPRVAAVQCGDLALGQRQPGPVGGKLGRAGVGPVGQQRKLSLRFGVGQVVQVQAAHQRPDAVGAGQHRRHHHHHPVLGRDAVVERQPRQRIGPGRFADQAVDQCHHRFGGRKQHEPGGHYPAQRVLTRASQQHRHQRQRA